MRVSEQQPTNNQLKKDRKERNNCLKMSLNTFISILRYGLRNRSAVVFKNTNHDITGFYFRQFFEHSTIRRPKKTFFNLQYLCDAKSNYFETSGNVHLVLNKHKQK